MPGVLRKNLWKIEDWQRWWAPVHTEKSSSPLFPHLPGRCGVAAATTDTVLAGCAFCPRTADSDGAPYRCRDQRKQRRWNGEAERLRGLQIDEQLILGRRLHRHIGGLFTLEDAIDVAGRAAELIEEIRRSALEADISSARAACPFVP